MRRDDATRLSAPYEGGPKEPRSAAFMKALRVDAPHWRALALHIFNDEFCPPSLGLACWSQHKLPVTVRILISDYLLQCLQSVQTNLIEARIHQLEWLEAAEAESAQIDRASKEARRIARPLSRCPADDLTSTLTQLHVAGTLRAVGSTLDNVAATAAVVAAVPEKLFRLTFSQLKESLAQHAKKTEPKPHPLLKRLAADIDGALSSSGPPGWDKWASDLRNTFVHRGRRLELPIMDADSILFDHLGRRIPRVQMTRRLPREPALTDMEFMRDFGSAPPFLNETTETTLTRLVDSLTEFVDAMGKNILSLWEERKTSYPELEQPTCQLKDRRRTSNWKFQGFVADAAPFSPRAYLADPVMNKRMNAAAMHDDQRKAVWEENPENQEQ